MKQFIAVYLGLGLCSAAVAGPSTPSSTPYANYGEVTSAIQIDSVSFYNAGFFGVNTVDGVNNNNNQSGLFGGDTEVLPYSTKDTLFYTNAAGGVMMGINGFLFETIGSTSIHSASRFLNQGTVTGIDLPAAAFVFAPPGSLTGPYQSVAPLSQPASSVISVQATNIVNQNIMEVGNYGVIHLAGHNVTNNFAALIAGAVDTGSDTPDPLDTTGGPYFDVIEKDGQAFGVDPPYNYDIFWGATNGVTMDASKLADSLPFTSGLLPLSATFRDGIQEQKFGLPINNNTSFAGYATENIDSTGTNIYFNFVCINTNFFGANNITATVGFTGGSFNSGTNSSANDDGAVIQFAEPVTDVTTGETVTNAVYLVDTGAFLDNGFNLLVNAGTVGGYSRPNAIEIMTTTPEQWIDAATGPGFSFPIDEMSFLIYEPNEFVSKTVTANAATYGAQVGRNPETQDGSFFAGLNGGIVETNFALDGFFEPVLLSDPTNEPARIEINANNLDMTQGALRAEGMVLMNITNLIGTSTMTTDYGLTDSRIGSTNGTLVISNIYPNLFQRVRGYVYAWEVSWVNTQTNDPVLGAVTNSVHYHVLVVDQNLQGSFIPTVRNLSLSSKTAITVEDNLRVLNQATFNTSNLSFNGTNTFTGNAANLTQANLPGLKNLFINTNAILEVDDLMELGFNQNQGQTSPTGRKYTINTITNYGLMEATAPLLQSAIFENDGTVSSFSGGSIVIQAGSLGLGLSLTNTNFLSAGGNIYLSANDIQITNSIITAGLADQGSLTLDATKQLTDFVSGTPTTNTNSVIINHWNVTGGFSLPVKPATGDLFGTEIHTIATNRQQAIHLWAGTDMGPTPAGFVNNEVIGRLVLDRLSSNSILRFSAASAKNAMYVDYLELTNYAYTNYRTGLVIDPNFKIYFADCNADPQKLMEVYPGLVWVQNFAGPNSTQVVPYFNSSNICLMNAALAQSTEISFFNGIANFYNQPYVLNNPSDPTETYPCPGDETMLRSFLVTSPALGGGSTLNLLNIAINGEGSISPDIQSGQVALGSRHTLTATAAKGWIFQNWSVIGLSASVNVNSRTLPFTFLTNTVITANFMANPFPQLQGSYSGLFFEPNAVNPGSSGAFSLTLASGGSFSGRLLMGPSAYTFSSQFTSAGGALFQAKSGAQSVTVTLQLDMTGQTGQIQGDVNGGAWDAALAANIAPVWTAQNPSPLAGGSRMVLPWGTGTGSSGGDGYGVGTVNKLGVLSMAGALADGVTFSAAAPVSQDGHWPLYVYASSGKDSVLGWVTVSNGLSGTNISWSKAAGKGPLYAAGFTNVLQLAGSPWQAPAKQTAALTLTNPAVILSGGNLPESQTIPVTLQNFLSYAGTNLTLSIQPGNGSFSGWFTSPVTGGKETILGVILQNDSRALGFFPGTNESGAVLLEGQ